MRTRDAVRMEIRAAEIAQALREKNNIMRGREFAGWMYEGAPSRYSRLTKKDMDNFEWQTGNLAAQIWYERYLEIGWGP